MTMRGTWHLHHSEHARLVRLLAAPTKGVRTGDVMGEWLVQFAEDEHAHVALISSGNAESPYLDVSLFVNGREVDSEVTLDVSDLPVLRAAGREYRIDVMKA